ncbi:MAG: hypothetical protein KJ659_11280 [Actinobacteria bacterium]|nr:hypothetical protein [Actinomycetota bacterium]MBU1607932.1 hypothetical protein [Actinomycetota bacterium]MBU2316108.1 hypothetical protein [Actinomycetota bacterium]MBU2386056.1 hypothetical protein [Actinomycetota bacterium]
MRRRGPGPVHAVVDNRWGCDLRRGRGRRGRWAVETPRVSPSQRHGEKSVGGRDDDRVGLGPRLLKADRPGGQIGRSAAHDRDAGATAGRRCDDKALPDRRQHEVALGQIRDALGLRTRGINAHDGGRLGRGRKDCALRRSHSQSIPPEVHGERRVQLALESRLHRQRPQCAGDRIEHGDHAIAEAEIRARAEGGERRDALHGGIDAAGAVGLLVVGDDGIADLENVQCLSYRNARGQFPHLKVDLAEQAGRLIRDPHGAGIEVDVGRRKARVGDREAERRGDEHGESRGRGSGLLRSLERHHGAPSPFVR